MGHENCPLGETYKLLGNTPAEAVAFVAFTDYETNYRFNSPVSIIDNPDGSISFGRTTGFAGREWIQFRKNSNPTALGALWEAGTWSRIEFDYTYKYSNLHAMYLYLHNARTGPLGTTNIAQFEIGTDLGQDKIFVKVGKTSPTVTLDNVYLDGDDVTLFLDLVVNSVDGSSANVTATLSDGFQTVSTTGDMDLTGCYLIHTSDNLGTDTTHYTTVNTMYAVGQAFPKSCEGAFIPPVRENAPSTYLLQIPSGEGIDSFKATTIMVHDDPGDTIIQAIDTGEKADSYWTDWGGNYDDLPPSTFFDVFIEQFLTKVDTLEDLLALEYTSYITGTQVYIHIPFYLFQIAEISSRLEISIGFSTCVADYNDPSDDTFGGVRYASKLKKPSLPLKLSDPINGINLAPSFSVSVMNNDGAFDPQASSKILNNPITVYRSSSYPATIDTFSKIRTGEIEDIKLSMTEITFSGADAFRTLEDPALRTFEESGLSTSGESLPLAYGTLEGVDLIEFSRVQDLVNPDIETIKFIVCDPNYFDSVTAVYNADGDVLTDYTLANGVFTFVIDNGASPAIDPNPSKCDFKGLNGDDVDRLGNIIISEVSNKTKLIYTDSFWNKAEVESYASTSPSLNLYFKSGNIKQLVSQVLKNDLVFFIQQNEGQMTLRKWGTEYTIHNYDSWLIKTKPTRSFSDFKYYYSSVIIEYGTNTSSPLSYLNTLVEAETVAEWKKKSRGVFQTNLKNENQAETLSNDILTRFAKRAEIWNFGLGRNTSGIELLDSIILPMIVNGRELSTFTQWKVIGINPSTDSITVEEDIFQPIVPVIERPAVPLSFPSNENASGFLSQPTNEDESGLLSQNTVT